MKESEINDTRRKEQELKGLNKPIGKKNWKEGRGNLS